MAVVLGCGEGHGGRGFDQKAVHDLNQIVGVPMPLRTEHPKGALGDDNILGTEDLDTGETGSSLERRAEFAQFRRRRSGTAVPLPILPEPLEPSHSRGQVRQAVGRVFMNEARGMHRPNLASERWGARA